MHVVWVRNICTEGTSACHNSDKDNGMSFAESHDDCMCTCIGVCFNCACFMILCEIKGSERHI